MGKKIDREGTFVGYAVQSGVGETRANKFPQFVAKLEATQEWDGEKFVDLIDANGTEITEERELTGYFVLFDKDAKPTLNAKQIKLALPEWSGSIKELNDDDYSEIPVQFRVEENTYKNPKTGIEKTSLQVSWIDHADAVPGGNVGKMDDDGIASIEAKYANAIRELQGGDKPKAIPAAKKVAGKKAAAKKPVILKMPLATNADKALSEELAASKSEGQERAAEAEYNALSPAEKRAYNKRKRAEAQAAVRTVITKKTKTTAKKSPPPKSTPPKSTPPLTESDPAQDALDALDLPATCDNQQAWDACEANVHESKTEILAEVWTKIVGELGGDDVVTANMDWPEARNRVIAETILPDAEDESYNFAGC
jgi:hypothetical protein